MEHLIAHGTRRHTAEEATAIGERLAAKQPSMEIDGILDALLRVPDDPQARQLLRSANIALTRASIRNSVAPDAHLIHAITAVEELDKLINIAAKRVRAWYALHDPELEHNIQDHGAFIAAVLEQPARSPDTMGADTPEGDLAIALSHAAAVSGMIAHRGALVTGIESTMDRIAPNLRHVAGATIGAKLLAIAGSLERLATMPAGTVQLLGAETALFRHLRNRAAKPPKHGVIFNHQAIQHARPDDRGRIARALADVISIASRVDRFKGEFIGDQLAAKLNSRAEEVRKQARPKREQGNDDRQHDTRAHQGGGQGGAQRRYGNARPGPRYGGRR